MLNICENPVYNALIKKPWGEEYCIYNTTEMSIWLLKIEPNKKTSLHCHPNKKTGLIILNGTAQINLIERSFTLNGLSKINLRNLIFHQTHNIGINPMFVIEVETPNNKFDLIRIEDDYGRENKDFEDVNNWLPVPANAFKINQHGETSYFNEYSFKIMPLSVISDIINSETVNTYKDVVIIPLTEFCFFDKKGNGLCEIGDVVSLNTFKLLERKFNLNTDTTASGILIWKF